jgi:hypothetical protein
MDVAKYLEEMGESEASLAARSGVPRSVINEVRNGYGTSAHYALLLINASSSRITLFDIASNPKLRGGGRALDRETAA